jgi:hypothetical protein
MATEEPKFESLLKAENFEIRRYAPQIIAETTVDGDMDSATGRGFRLIADYIFGNNERIAMTAPVVSEAQSSAEKIAMTTPVSIEPQNAGRGYVSISAPRMPGVRYSASKSCLDLTKGRIQE